MLSRCVLVACGLAGCAIAPAPYQFSSPLIAGVDPHTELLPAPTRRMRTPTPSPATRRPPVIDRADLLVAADPDPLPPEELPAPIDPARLPSAHHELHRPLPIVGTPGDLRTMTGTRTIDDPLAFAVAAAAAITERAGPDPVPTDGEALAGWARAHATAVEPARAEPGDLLVFDHTDGDRPASLWAVMLGRDSRGVIEMLYVAAGVVRRGFVDPARPHVARGPDRAVHNTFLRHGRTWPPAGTRFLAGELLGGGFRLASGP